MTRMKALNDPTTLFNACTELYEKAAEADWVGDWLSDVFEVELDSCTCTGVSDVPCHYCQAEYRLKSNEKYPDEN